MFAGAFSNHTSTLLRLSSAAVRWIELGSPQAAAYFVIPGGVRSAYSVARFIAHDELVRDHYARIDVSSYSDGTVGAVEHGLFPGITAAVYVARQNGVEVLNQPPPAK